MTHSMRAEPLRDWHGPEPSILTWNDLDVVVTMLAEMAPGWSAELNQSSLDEVTIVVIPEGANDLIGPAFILYRNSGRVHLDQFRWDEYRKLGGFGSLEHALAAMRSRLMLLVNRRVPEAEDGV